MVRFDDECTMRVVSTRLNQRLIEAHAWIMILVWAVLIPAAVLWARYNRVGLPDAQPLMSASILALLSRLHNPCHLTACVCILVCYMPPAAQWHMQSHKSVQIT